MSLTPAARAATIRQLWNYGLMPMDTKSAIRALGALAQDTRLAIFRMLVERGPEGLAAGAIAEALDLPASSLSFHLAQLSHSGLVIQRRESRSLIYSIDFDTMGELMGYLTENCCGGNSAACLPVARPSTKPSRTRKSA
jgi:DNA-binding transcriptional ArsR family regulator